MSYIDKVASATSLIVEHNGQLEDPKDQINTDTFISKLKKFGGTTESALSECTWEDLENCGLPRILARKVAGLFRASSLTDPKYLSDKKVQQMHPLYLLQAYIPTEPTSNVAKKLAELSRGAKFIVFTPGTQSINIEASGKLLAEVQKGFPQRDEYELDGKFVKTYSVGEGVWELVDENPLYPGRPLRPDGTCDQTNRSWAGVSFPLRQLVYLAFGKKGVNIEKAHDVLDTVVGVDGEKKIRSRYPKIAIELDELAQSGQSPSMKIKLSSNGFKNGKSNNPFFAEHRQY